MRHRTVASETWSRSITGGTMLIARANLQRAGGGVYRTHAGGCVMVRHGGRQTWRRDDAAFLTAAQLAMRRHAEDAR